MHQVNFSKIDLNLLKLFDALLKERSVTRAGQRLGLSQPAASRGLARLRKLLNDQLMVRTSHGLELTPRALDLSASVTRLLEDARSIITPPSFDPLVASGIFRIATTDHFASLLIPALVATLEQTAPYINLKIPSQKGDSIDSVMQGDVDLAIGVYDELPARFHQRSLYSEDLVCLLRDKHPVLTKQWTLERFLSLSHISLIVTGYGSNAIDSTLAKQGLSRRVAVQLPHFLAAPMLVAKSDMALALPRRLAHQIANSTPMKILEIPLPLKPFTSSMIWHERWHNDPAHQWLRTRILETSSDIK